MQHCSMLFLPVLLLQELQVEEEAQVASWQGPTPLQCLLERGLPLQVFLVLQLLFLPVELLLPKEEQVEGQPVVLLPPLHPA